MSPGEEGFLELELEPATDYFGYERAIVVRETGQGLGILPEELTDEWWPFVCAMADAKEIIYVDGRLWTSEDWGERFYASIRVNLPPLQEAIQAAEDDFVELTEDNWQAHETAKWERIDYTNPTWRERHGMTDEGYREQVEATEQRLKEMGYDFGPSTTAVRPSASAVTPGGADWHALMLPDDTPRATAWQRGYARGIAGQKLPGNRAPRMDYATVGQIKRVVSHFGGDLAEVDRRGGKALTIMTRILLILLILVALVALGSGAWPVTALIAAPFVYHYATRTRLKPPFSKNS